MSRSYLVMYDLAYDGGGSRWHKFYRTRWGAHTDELENP